jgi:hypothetical protein
MSADPNPGATPHASTDPTVPDAGAAGEATGDDAAASPPGDGATGAVECPYCGRRFARTAWRDLHLGLEHAERLDAGERAAYEAAHDAEAEEIRMFRLKALAVLVLVYFGFLLVYAFTL